MKIKFFKDNLEEILGFSVKGIKTLESHAENQYLL